MHGFAFRSIFLSLVLVASAEATTLQQSPKKTACTITINSSDESDLFRAKLSDHQWNFIELTDPADPHGNWFQRACEKKIECDILIISGHFGGSFFGTESEVRLSMEALESRSCLPSCAGITKRPKEVFLFGCNTLASKEKDSRSPEVYQRTLIRDGFTPAQASQVAAFRYSALGDSFRERMTQVFSNSPRIYGFSAMAPSGKTAAPFLEKYLKSSERFYANFESASYQLGTQQNNALKTAFKYSTLVQSAGVYAEKAKLFRKSPASETPFCYLGSETNSRLAKLKFIQKSLKAGKAFGFIAHINDFVSNQELNLTGLNPEEIRIVLEIAQDPGIRRDFERYLKLPGEVYLPVRIGVLNLMKGFGVLTEAEAAIQITQALNLDFSKPISRKTIDKVCAYELRTDLDVMKIPEVRFTEYGTFEVMRCLRPRNREIHERILDAFLKNPHVTFIASSALSSIRPTSPSVLNRLADAADSATDSEVRRYAIDVLSEIQITDLTLLRRLIKILKYDKDIMIRQNVAYAFRLIMTENIEVLRAIVESMLHDPEWSVRSAAGEALEIQNSHDPEIEKYRYVWEGRVP